MLVDEHRIAYQRFSILIKHIKQIEINLEVSYKNICG